MTLRIGINGFGRIGRLATRLLAEQADITLSHINDPALGPAQAAHLLAFDSVHGRWSGHTSHTDLSLLLNGREVGWSQSRGLADWSDLSDLVIDCSGRIKRADDLAPYWQAGIKKVLVSAPVDGIPNIVVGVNDDDATLNASSGLCAASCTTNCLGIIVKVIHEELTISNGFITTIHGLTNDQALLDQAHDDWRRGRAAGSSLIPTSSGFAKAIGRVLPELEGRLQGFAIRAPICNASLVDASLMLELPTDARTVNRLLSEAANGALAGLLAVEDRPLVSADFLGDTHSATIDSALTAVQDRHHLKLVAWYDNETGYTHRLVELATRLATLTPPK